MGQTTLRKYAVTLDDSTAGSRKISFLPYKAGLNTFATSGDWTPGAGDFHVAKAVTGSGFGAEANIGTAPTWVNGHVVVILSGTELTCQYLTIRIENAAINSDEIIVETYGNASAMYAVDYSAANLPADAVKIGGTTQTGRDIGASVLLAASQHVIVDSGTITTYTGNTPQTGDAYTRIGAAGAGLTALGDSRIANLDAAISSLNNLSALCNIYGSPLLEIPDSSTTTFAFTVVTRDNEGKLKDLDSSPTIAAANAAGTDRSSNLSAVSHPSTGRYTFTYGVSSAAAEESLRITVSGLISSEARYVEWVGAVVNYDSLTTLNTIASQTTAANIRAAVGMASANLDTQVAAISTKIGTPLVDLANDIAVLTGDVDQASAEGTVVSTTGTTTTLDTSATNTNDFYIGSRLRILAGTGKGQEEIITAYTSSRVATHKAWVTNPTGSSTYEIRPAKVYTEVLGTQAKTDMQAAMTAQGYTTTRAAYLDNINVSFGNTTTMASRWLGMVELSAGLYRYTVLALANAPSGGGGGGGDTVNNNLYVGTIRA